MSNVLKMLSRGGATDPNFNQTVLLLHGDGTNGAQNNTFLDSSTNNFTITRNGNTTQGTFSPFSLAAGEWSNYFDGTDDYLSVADNAVLRPGAGAFTLEAWIYRNASGAAHTVYAKGGASTGIVLQVTSTNVLRFTHTTTNIDSTGTVAANAWVHVAVVREGTGTNQTKLYINGVQDGQGTVSTDFTQTEEVRIGTNRGATDDFAGYISNVRFVKGSALYTAGFTPSTVPLTTTSQGASSSEVELLTCQSNRFVDNSTNAFAITRNGDVRVTPFSPFAPTAAYSAGTNGGSGYFDGTGDFLSSPNNSAIHVLGSDFCLEGWFYLTAAQRNAGLYSTYNAGPDGGYLVRLDTSVIRFFYFTGSGSITIDRSFTFTQGQWYHFAVTNSGGTGRIFVDGVQQGVTFTISATANSTQTLQIGQTHTTTNSFPGYLSNFRVVKGSAVYTSNFTPSTTPLTAITNTSLLLNFTNAGIIDNTGKNVLETVGNAQIDTAVKKYGTGSMKFDENGDYLTLPSTIDVAFGTGNFTIEMWARFAVSTVGNGQGLFQLSNGYLNSQVRGPAAGCDNTTGRWAIYSGTTQTTHGSLVPSTNTWYHVAYVRNSGTTKLYIDGTEIISVADTTNYTDTNFTIAGWYSSGFLLNGYIDDLRITKGVARYTANFTAPTKEFPDL